MKDFTLNNQWALVTGSSKGIGREVALHLARYGADLILTARDRGELQEVASEIEAMDRRALVVSCDLARPDDIRHLAQEALSVGTVDVLVHVAGVVYPNTALDQTVEEWDKTLNINLRAPFLLSQALAPAMIKKGTGRIIMISSAAGIVGFPERAAYAASKGGMNMLVRQLAVEWGPLGLRVNVVAPTVTLTQMAEVSWADPARRAAMEQKIPTRRFATPRDVANAVLYLASPGGDMINGVVLPVDGGYTIQ